MCVQASSSRPLRSSFRDPSDPCAIGPSASRSGPPANSRASCPTPLRTYDQPLATVNCPRVKTCALSALFVRGSACEDLDKGGLPGSGEWPVLGLELRLHRGEDFEGAIERRVVVGRHDARAQQ